MPLSAFVVIIRSISKQNKFLENTAHIVFNISNMYVYYHLHMVNINLILAFKNEFD